ncbi:MAG: ATP-binding protein [Bdellovibrionota bacterium]
MIWIQNEKNRLIVESSRVGLLFLILIFSSASFIFQGQFIDWSYLTFFYIALILGLSLHLGLMIKLNWFYQRTHWLLATFILDLFLISTLVYQSGLNQTFFLFIFMVLITLGGFVFRVEGALSLALCSSIFFSFASFWTPELRNMQHILLLAINNVAFFVIAGLSGYLSEQLFKTDKELQRTGLNLIASEKLNSLLIENIPSGLISFDLHGQILQANASSLGLLEEASLVGKNIQDYFSDFTNETRKLFDVKFETKNKTEKILEVRKNQFTDPSTGKELDLVLFDDLTKIRELESRLRQNEKLAAIGQLAAGIAHEIRNPLASISGSIEMLSQHAKTEDDSKLMKIILREIDRLNNLITEFLDYSRPLKDPTEFVQLSSILNEVIESLKMNKNLKSHVLIEKDFTAVSEVLGHVDKLKQVFLNLMVNAYQAMNDVQEGKLRVSLKSDEANQKVIVKISDSGMGMSESVMKRLYEPFHTTKPKGTGLGLAVSYKILESHKVEVSVKSQVGQGTEFTLIFPCVKARDVSKL